MTSPRGGLIKPFGHVRKGKNTGPLVTYVPKACPVQMSPPPKPPRGRRARSPSGEVAVGRSRRPAPGRPPRRAHPDRNHVHDVVTELQH